MGQIIEAEHQVVKERTLEVIAAEIRTIDAQLCQTVLRGAVEIGLRIKEAKEQIGHGNWESWCRENLNYSEDWAGNLMKIAEKYGEEGSLYFSAVSNPDTCRDLSISKALRLLKVPENEVENFVEKNHPADLTVKQLEEKIRELTGKNEDIGDDLVAVQEDYNRTKEEKEILEKQIRDLKRQIEETESHQEGDAEEIEAVHAAMERAEAEKTKAEEKAQKLKTKLNRMKADLEAEKEKAIEAARKEAEEEAEKKLGEAVEEKKKEAEAAEVARKEAEEREREALAKLDKASNPNLAVFAAKRQILRNTFTDMLGVIEEEEDPEQKEKYIRAADGSLKNMKEELEQI